MERLSEAFVVIFLGGAHCSLMLFVPLWGPQLVFARLAARHPVQTRTYTINDALVLTLFVAFSNALVALIKDRLETGLFVALALSANVLVVLIWIKCQRFMNERSIERWSSRILVQALLYPLSVIAVGKLSFSILALLSLLEVFENGLITGAQLYFCHPMVTAATATLLLAIATIFGIRSSFRRFVGVGCADIAIERTSDLAVSTVEATEQREPE